jgi:hypothetical protein
MKKTLLFPALALLLGFNIQAQEKVYFPFFELINVHTEYQYSTSKLLKAYCDNAGKYQIILPAKQTDGSAYSEAFEQTWDKAKNLGARYFMTGELNALQEKMIVSISLYNTSDGMLVWNDILKAATLDDMDPILILLSKSIGSKSKASELEDIYSVSQYDSQELAKKEANTSFGIFLGGVYTMFSGVDQNFSSGLGARITYDSRELILDITGEAYFGEVEIVDINLSGYYPFSSGKKTPLIGGGLGFGSHKIIYDETTINGSVRNSGLIMYAHGGYLFNRTSSVQMRGMISLYTATYEVDGKLPYGAALNLTFSF